ncbi:Serine/threonine-protein kinase B [Acaryochloris thomasi RCC1774]|uniref:non-specific serine/threonine protein kinase n=1 Tax=Acaryochloris thomasi RCC1774 TaxID=1764569 RepID=A0A2W1JX63_9CYAN|nr:protein kinase [Acaryochloris thomasi]PZD72937.1 Serine/threonine-protein kinase B [Acaryochloris thomasi RCC1774]
MDLMNCTSCGQQVASKSHFCQYCGTSLKTQPSGRSPAIGSDRSDLAPHSLEGAGNSTSPNFASSSYIALPAGTRLRDRYIIDRPLGQGGFGRTYLAQDTGRFNESIVLKELTPSIQGTAALKKAEELFQREAATLHRLEHPQIPRFWEIFQAEKRLFLVQDYIAGHTYQQLQEKQVSRAFKESDILQLFRDLLPVLSYLHQEGVIHRDISPDNIMCRDRDRLPILIDLGGVKQVAMDVATEVISPQASGFSSKGGTRLGKVGYAPDEQMRLGLVAPHSDLYALAVSALVLMTGKLPQDLQDPQSLEWTWQQDLSLNPDFSAVLQTMLAARPLDRYQSAAEVMQALNAPNTVPPTEVVSIAGSPPSMPPPTLIDPPSSQGNVATAGTTNPAQPPIPPTVQGTSPVAVSQPKSGNAWKWGCAIASLIVLLPVGLLTLLVIIGIIVGPQDDADEPTSSSPSPELTTSPSPQTQSQFQRVQIRALEPYEHQTQGFSISAPQRWTLKDNSKSEEIIMVWTDPTGNGEMVADLFDVASEPSQAELTEIVETFLTETFSDKPDFFIEDARPQKDGSVLLIWGYTGTATGDIKVELLGNSFIENKGQRVALLSYIVPEEQFQDLESTLNKMINTFKFDPAASLSQ